LRSGQVVGRNSFLFRCVTEIRRVELKTNINARIREVFFNPVAELVNGPAADIHQVLSSSKKGISICEYEATKACGSVAVIPFWPFTSTGFKGEAGEFADVVLTLHKE